MRAALIAILFVLVPCDALAWGQIGHRITGAIAEPLLSVRATEAVHAIIGNETLAEASTWADEMRSDPDPFWQTTANPWHYVTVPLGHTYAEVGPPAEGDAVTALRQFASTLRDAHASLADKQRALRFTIHIIGDLHQPLHVGNGVDHDVHVSFFGQPSTLHAVWDSGLIERRQLSYTEYSAFLSRRITPELRERWSSPDPLVRIAESAVIRDSLYPDNPQLSYDYVYRERDTVDERLMQAGVRIAAYLNALFA